LLQGGVSQAQTVASTPTLQQQVAEVTSLSDQVDSLGQQVDALRIELTQAKGEVKTAQQAQRQAQAAMAGSQQAVAQLAAMGYMNGGTNQTLQVLAGGNPSDVLNQEATVEQVNNEAGMRVTSLQNEQIAAERAQVTAKEEIAHSDQLQASINGKLSSISAKEAQLNSSVLQGARQAFDQTGTIPAIAMPAVTNIETHALAWARTRLGDPYLWSAAGPYEFDCSGLVVWAYGQLGIPLPHFTGSLWNEGMHISESDLQPGDLVFFNGSSSLDHVGFYVGDGIMLDAPHTGAVVREETIASWGSAYAGAVRIA
jgi:cell wall-associated NlpC family hydrolase